MGRNTRFDLPFGSQEPGFVGNGPNRQKGKFSVRSLNWYRSFREGEGGESRMLGSGTRISRCNGTSMGNLLPLSQRLMLEPIMMEDQQYTRFEELRRVMGSSTANATDPDCKPSPPVNMDELTRYKASVVDVRSKARSREKLMEEHLHKLDKHFEAGSSNEQSGGLSIIKMATQNPQNPPDLVTQRISDRTKNVALNKRQRTSVRAEYQRNGQPRQPVVMAEDQDMFKDSGAGSDPFRESTHTGLPAGGEGWDKTTKRKRSVGTASMRRINSDRDLKSAMHHELSSEPRFQSCDSQGFRSESLNCTSGTFVQRPQKVSRTRKGYLDSSSDFSGRMTVGGTDGPPLSNGVANCTQKCKLKLENVSSPARLSESEESGAIENRFKKKGMGSDEVDEKTVNAVHNVGSSVMLTKKSKLLVEEDIGDGGRNQRLSRRGSSFDKTRNAPIMEKLENGDTRKPSQSPRPGSDKNESKLVPSSKKLSDCKGLSKLGHIPASNSPDFSESDNDHEELLAAANFACNGLTSSSLFWKKMEQLFASVSCEDISYISEQVITAIYDHQSISKGDLQHGKTSPSLVAGERDRSLQNKVNMKESARTVEVVNQFQYADTLRGKLDSERRVNEVIPLYQRVLSALIAEDYTEESEEDGTMRNVLPQCPSDDSPYDTYLLTDAKHRKRDRMDFGCESRLGVQTQKQVTVNKMLPSCNGSTTSNRSTSILNHYHNEDFLNADSVFVQSEFVPQNGQTNDFGISSFNCQYEQMCLNDKLLLELQSIGLYPDKVPDMDSIEDEVINQEIVQLKKGVHKQVCWDKICKAINKGRETERRELEQVAINKLVELANKKQLATQGSSAKRRGVAKVSKQEALAFAETTLAKCPKFEDSGTSCFSEPARRDVISRASPRGNEAEKFSPAHPESCNLQPDCTVSGSFPDKSKRGSSDGFETPTNQSDLHFVKSGPRTRRLKKEALPDVVGGSAGLRAASTTDSTFLGITKGKRSARERGKDTSIRNVVAEYTPALPGHVKPERRTKTKTKKTAQPSISGSEDVGKFTEATTPMNQPGVSNEPVMNGSDSKREVGLMSAGKTPENSVKETKEQMDFPDLPLIELDSIKELGVGTKLDSCEDLAAWLDIDEDGLQELESVGLEIPMDDLSGLNIF